MQLHQCEEVLGNFGDIAYRERERMNGTASATLLSNLNPVILIQPESTSNLFHFEKLNFGVHKIKQ